MLAPDCRVHEGLEWFHGHTNLQAMVPANEPEFVPRMSHLRMDELDRIHDQAAPLEQQSHQYRKHSAPHPITQWPSKRKSGREKQLPLLPRLLMKLDPIGKIPHRDLQRHAVRDREPHADLCAVRI